MGKFNLPLQTPYEAFNTLLGNNQIEEINSSLLDEVNNQPFPINEEKIEQIADSILSVGLLEPVLVRRNGERYEILSGRHRYRACKKLGRDKIKCIVMSNLDDNKARYILITTNTERNNDYAPSVYAKAYAEEVEILKKIGHNNPSVAAVAERHGINRKQIQRYLRLNSLIPEFLNLVDNQSIPFMVGVELSLLSSESQKILFDFLKGHREIKITVDAAKELRSCGDLSDDILSNFFFSMKTEKNDKPKPKKTKTQKIPEKDDSIIFESKNHKKNYNTIIEMMNLSYADTERMALAYLFALDEICFEHINDLYDFMDREIITEGFDKSWQTGTSRKTTRLAFNLYNGWCSDGETYIESDGSTYFTPVNIFCCSYAPYYVEAMKIRFPEYFGLQL